jgi:hypothetical protein
MNEVEKNSWIERLKFYTSDFNSEEIKKLTMYICWVKCEGLIKECDEIVKLIESSKTK